MKKRFLLTHGRSPVVLDLARLLKSAGHEVMIADSHSIHITRFSNAVKKSFIIPAPRFNPEGFIQSLVTIVKEHKIDMLIPTFEEIFTLSESLHKFPRECKVFTESFEKLYPLHNKWLFNQKLKTLGFLAPKSYLASTRDMLENIPLPRPYILKPSFSRQAQNLILIEENKPPPHLTFEQSNPWVAQEYLHGKKYCTYSICYHGKVLAHTAYPVDVTVEGSSCVLFKPIRHQKIQNWVEKFVHLEKFTGQIAFDFIEGDELHAIECNPRATSGLHLFNDSDQLERAFLNTVEEMIIPKDNKGKQLAPGMLFYGWRHVDFKSYCKYLLDCPDVVFAKKDLKPFLSMPLVFAFYMQKCFKHKLSLPHLFTYDVDWNNESRRGEQFALL